MSFIGAGQFWIPSAGVPELNYTTARFACKTAVNIYAERMSCEPEGNQLVVSCEQLDEIRNYVRRGRPDFVWPVQIRRIYEPSKTFDDNVVMYERLNEFTILFLPEPDVADSGELYAVFAILGVEFVVNIGGPSLERYLDWQKANGERSYLDECTVSDTQDIG